MIILVFLFLMLLGCKLAYTTGFVDGRIEEKERRRWK